MEYVKKHLVYFSNTGANRTCSFPEGEMVPESGSEILQVPSEKRAKEVVAWRKRQEDNLKAGFIFVCILLNALFVQKRWGALRSVGSKSRATGSFWEKEVGLTV